MLLPGRIGDHQHHGIESQGMTHVHRSHKMADVGRIERATEQSDSQGHG